MGNRKLHRNTFLEGSALILTVVLTSLLAVIGVVFIMVARVDRISALAISDNKELNFAVDAVMARISEELISDVPGMRDGEFSDYPGQQDRWLASLEPFKDDANDYRWLQISDITGFLKDRNFATRYVKVDPEPGQGMPFNQDVIREYPEIKLDANGELDAGNSDDGELNNEFRGQLADADGDGIADSKWIRLENVTTGKGEPIYAAVRIVDSGGMVNVNTAYRFDLLGSREEVDGSSQMQIDLDGLARAGDSADEIHIARCDSNVPSWQKFQEDVVWSLGLLPSRYVPFDISDELELRYRYCINSPVLTRFEQLWQKTIGADSPANRDKPYAGGSLGKLSDWQKAVTDPYDPNNSRRYMLTAYNMDRIITPRGDKMLNVNTADKNSLKDAISTALADVNLPDPNALAAQMAVNIHDYLDNDSDISTIDVNGVRYYGFESPCVYISELAQRFVPVIPPGGPIGAPPQVAKSYAVELYKPYFGDNDPCMNQWQLVVDGNVIPISDWKNHKQFYVIRNIDLSAPLTIDPNTAYYDSTALVFDSNSAISLQRVVDGNFITVDSKIVPHKRANWLDADSAAHSIQRDITLHKCIRRLWDANSALPTLGRANSYTSTDSVCIQAHPADKTFTNLGEIEMVFRRSAYGVGPLDKEGDVRIDLTDPNLQKLTNYLTVFDPALHASDVNETRVKGRININTAPWYVLARLPWVSKRKGGFNNDGLAQAIVAYRDKLASPVDYSGTTGRGKATGIRHIREKQGFASIAELTMITNNQPLGNVYDMRYYGIDSADLGDFPDLTPNDGAIDDIEERDVIFSRISNLVTVRSDVFTAYVLVRIGTSGPQKKVMAILDRSGVRPDGTGGVVGDVKIIALQPVADPR